MLLAFWIHQKTDRYCWWTKSCTTKDDDYPIIYRVLTIPGGAGFCPSTVCVCLRYLFGAFSEKKHENQDFMCTLLATNISRNTRYVLSRWFVRTSRFFWGYVCTTVACRVGSFRNPFREHFHPQQDHLTGSGSTLPDGSAPCCPQNVKNVKFRKGWKNTKNDYGWSQLIYSFNFHPENLGKMNPILTSIFFKGGGSTTN